MPDMYYVAETGFVRWNVTGWDDDKPKPGIDTCIFSTWNEKYKPIANIVVDNWKAYCERHGYALRFFPGAYHEDPARPDTYGDKVKFSLYYDLRGLFRRVMWLDIDSLFVRMENMIPSVVGGLPYFLWTHADGGPMSGLWIAGTDDRTERHLRYTYEYAAHENNVRNGVIEPNGISDQDAMTRLMNVPPFSDTFRWCVEATGLGLHYPDTKTEKPWIVTCRGGSLEDKIAGLRRWGAKAPEAEVQTATQAAFPPDGEPDPLPTPEETVETRRSAWLSDYADELRERHSAYLEENGLVEVRPPTPEETAQHHPVPEYNPSFQFDRSWIGPRELKPRVYRTQTEKDTWYSVVVENEYSLPDKFGPDDVVIDIGAHIGSLSWAAYQRGSRSVYAFEIDPWHVEAAAVNLGGCKDGVQLHHAAVVRSDTLRAKEYHYAGAWNSFAPIGPVVGSFSLDEIIAQVIDPVRFLKIDCEGGEWPILYTCHHLNHVQEIHGEFHLMDTDGVPELQELPYPVSMEGLEAFLRAEGFSVKIALAKGATKTGLFSAVREPLAVATGGYPFANVVKLG